jgi:hypothetical protein
MRVHEQDRWMSLDPPWSGHVKTLYPFDVLCILTPCCGLLCKGDVVAALVLLQHCPLLLTCDVSSSHHHTTVLLLRLH